MAFSEWLLQKIEESGLSYSEIGRRGGISHARISQVINGEKPGADFCVAVARGLKISPAEVLRQAGFLPLRPERDPDFEALESLWNLAPVWKRKDIVAQLRATIEEHQHKLTKKEQRPIEPNHPPQEKEPSPPEGEDAIDVLTRMWPEISPEQRLEIYELLLAAAKKDLSGGNTDADRS